MKIKDNDIEAKSIAGHTKDGQPIMYVRSFGGLHAVFKRAKDGGVESIAAAPHIAIMKFLAEKKEPELKWEEDFHKSEDLAKSESNMFVRMRNIMFSPNLETPLNNPEDLCLVYDYQQKTMQVMTKAEIKEDKSLCSRHIIRNLSMTESALPKDDFLAKSEE